jgi:hypothetical protein
MIYECRDADLIFTRNPSWLGRAIRWCCRGAGEEPSYTNHVAGISSGDVIEALWTVKRTPFAEWIDDNPAFQVWRKPALTNLDCRLIALQATNYVHRKYGWWKLGAHLGDCLIAKVTGGNPYFFRRLFFMDEYPICSWVWACAYDSLNIQFGATAACVDPDMMHDHVSQDPQWVMAYSKCGQEA